MNPVWKTMYVGEVFYISYLKSRKEMRVVLNNMKWSIDHNAASLDFEFFIEQRNF